MDQQNPTFLWWIPRILPRSNWPTDSQWPIQVLSSIIADCWLLSYNPLLLVDIQINAQVAYNCGPTVISYVEWFGLTVDFGIHLQSDGLRNHLLTGRHHTPHCNTKGGRGQNRLWIRAVSIPGHGWWFLCRIIPDWVIHWQLWTQLNLSG